MLNSKPIKVIATSDVHGTLSAYAYYDRKPKAMGLSRYSSYLSSLQNEELIVLDNGDSLQGSPLLTYSHQTQQRPVIMAQIFNQLQVQYLNLGNHDFNYGPQRLLDYLEDCDAECLTSNILYHAKPLGKSVIHTTSEGFKIGLIGVCTDYIPHWEKPSHLEGFTFLDPLEVVKHELSHLRPLVDRLIVMYHGGLEKDPKTGLPTEVLTGENVGYEIACLDGIDVLITGHQHRSLIETIHSTLVTQSTLNAQEAIEIDVLNNTAQRINLGNYAIDEGIESSLEPLQSHTQSWLDQSLGILSGYDLRIDDAFDARLHKHPLVSFINQVQLDVSNAQLSATSLFNQPIGLNAHVSYRDLVSTYIYPNSLVVKEVTGAILKSYLEKCAEYFCIKNNQISVNPEYDEPKPQHFNYDMVDGCSYELNIAKPIGQRVHNLRYENKLIHGEDVFSLVLNNYRAVGGGNFTMIAESKTLLEIQEDMVEILAAYIQSNSPISLKHQENIKIYASMD